jgi:hypothetical protein
MSRTNEDLYKFIEALPSSKRPLEAYLRALWALLAPHRDEDGVSYETFAAALRDAETTEPPKAPPDRPLAKWETLIWRQAADLKELARKSRNPQAYFGLDTKAGQRWYNFGVDGFLERGAEGAFHGWDPHPEDIEDLSWLGWEEIHYFLIMGQYYE